MKNAGMAGAVALVGIGLITIGLGTFANTPQAIAAAPAVVVEAGPEDATIVWYGTESGIDPVGSSSAGSETVFQFVYRAWSDGTVEVKAIRVDVDGTCDPFEEGGCDDSLNDWRVISSPNEGMSAAADINFDEIVDGQDLGVLLAAWGNAPRKPMPASDCPLGLLNP